MSLERRNRVVAMVGSALTNLKTCTTLIEHDVNLVGICICDQRLLRLPFRYVWKSVRRYGVGTAMGQIAGRIYYRLLNRVRDLHVYRRLYDEVAIQAVLQDWQGEIHRTKSYSDDSTIDWLRGMRPDIIVVHTPYWISKRVRKEANRDIVIGGHPGITPQFRGSHPAFWAMYQGNPAAVGYSVFWLDGGVDTGDLIYQGRVLLEPGDSFMTVQWKGMLSEAEVIARVIRDYDHGIEIPRIKHAAIPANSEYRVPTLGEYLAYRRRQSVLR